MQQAPPLPVEQSDDELVAEVPPANGWNVLELFCGTKSVGKVAEPLGCSVTSLDIRPETEPDICVDLLEWNGYLDDDFVVPDFIWASVVCVTFSVLAASKHRNKEQIWGKTAAAAIGNRLLAKVLDIIRYFQAKNPKLRWCIENPRGLMRSMPHLEGVTRTTANYCQYDEWKFFKPTDFFTNFPMELKECVEPERANCHHHEAGGVRNSNSLDERYAIPPSLVKSILDQALAASDESLTEPPKPVFPPEKSEVVTLAEGLEEERKQAAKEKSRDLTDNELQAVIYEASANCFGLPSIAETVEDRTEFGGLFDADAGELKESEMVKAIKHHYSIENGDLNDKFLAAYNLHHYIQTYGKALNATKKNGSVNTSAVLRHLDKKDGVKIKQSTASRCATLAAAIDSFDDANKPVKFLIGCRAPWRVISALKKPRLQNALHKFQSDHLDQFSNFLNFATRR
jgi:hypothetical protein